MFADTGVSNGTWYHYGVWVQRDGAFSASACTCVGLPTDPASVVAYTAAPTGAYAGTDPNWVMGTVFHVTADKALTKLGRVYKAGSTAGNQVGIWDGDDGALLASANVTPAAPTRRCRRRWPDRR